VAIFASLSGVASGDCLYWADLAGPGATGCEPPKTGWTSSPTLAGATTAGGATVSNLYAVTTGEATHGTDSATVAVIDNRTGATLISCTVNSTTVNHCANSSTGGTAAAGDYIEVKITATTKLGNGKWRVTFRY
jgi:hypothetical protein